jgi:transitional endoplasmic reticulum ATPase
MSDATTLKITETSPKFVGRGIALIDPRVMKEMGLSTRDVVEIAHVAERVISQMLTELDGLEDLKGVVVIRATNRRDMIDEALLRPGRFDRILELSIPDVQARKEILKIHTAKKPLDSSVNLDKLVETTDGMTGADIAAVVNMAAIKEQIAAGGKGRPRVRMAHFEMALQMIKKKSSAVSTSLA